MISKVLLSAGLIFFVLSTAFSQKTLRGQITDEKGYPLFAVSVGINAGQKRGTITDLEGRYQLDILPTDTSIVVSYIGYKTQKLQLANPKESEQDTLHIDIRLQEYDYFGSPVIIIAQPELEEAVTSEQVVLPAGTAAKVPSIDKLVNTVPGVYMQSGSLNTNRLTIRGGGNRAPFATSGIKIYVDNVPVHDNSGNSALEDFGTHILENAQILKGPTGPGYGSGLGGGIVVDTDTRRYNEGSHVQSYTEAGAYGTVRTANALELNSAPYTSGPNQHLRVQHSYTHTDGYRANNEVNRQNFTVNYRVRHRAHTLKVLANVVQLDAQIPGALSLSDYTADPRQAAAIWQAAEGYENSDKNLLGATYEYAYALESKATLTAYLNGRASEELRPFNTIRDTTSTSGIRAKVDHFIYFRNGSLQLTAGYDLQVEQYDFSLLQTEDKAVGDFIRADSWRSASQHTYINTTLRLDSGWDVNIGQEYAVYTTQATDENRQHNTALLPVLTITRQLPWARAYAKVSRGATFPAAEQQTQNQLTQATTLGPESGWNYETGLKGYQQRRHIGYRLAVYHMQVTDQLVQRTGPDDTSFLINGGSSQLSGLEWSVRKVWRLSRDSRMSGSVASTHTLHRFDEFEEGAVSYDGNQLPGSPDWTLHATVAYEAEKLALGIAAHHVSRYAIDDGNTTYNEAYTILTTTLDYFLVKNSHWNISFHMRGENFTNTTYASMTSINARSFGSAPRYYYGGLPANISGGILLKYQW